jgi:DNA-binding HxlR family transcriptional regulator
LDKTISNDCQAVNEAWNSLSKVWTLPIIHTLGAKEPARFNELKRRIAGISATSLAERLTELEQLRIIERKVYPETPPRVEYSLTKKGWELHAQLVQLADWVKKWNRQEIVATPISKR